MIRVYKHPVAPASLAKCVSWSGDDVLARLMADQRGKCYLCERILTTDFQVEHYKSRKHYAHLTYEWTNLLWSCSYCNGKKSSEADDLLNPTADNIEELVRQKIDFPKAKVKFTTTGPATASTECTIRLLDKIFNGSKRLRTIREQRFYDYAVSKITSFQDMVIRWLNTGAEETERAIIEELALTSEFLGFKYWIIMQNKRLAEAFGGYIVWNRR